MSKVGIIGGSALNRLRGFVVDREIQMDTRFGPPSSPLFLGRFAGADVVFLDRHGKERTTPPHKINYRANFLALQALGVSKVIGLSIVGGIRSDMTPGHFVFPDQLIDYTYGRPSSVYEDNFDVSRHVDFTYPYCGKIHRILVDSAQALGLNFSDDATYGVSQGPRFETIAEINRLERDGCDIVGMTAMPEAILARELGMAYATIAVVGTKAAGRSDGLHVSVDAIRDVFEDSIEKMCELLSRVVVKL
jgi:5'-methylthioinosine phosphorylase